MPDEPVNGVHAVPEPAPVPPSVTVERRAEGQVHVSYTDGTEPEFFIEAAMALLRARAKLRTAESRLVVPVGLLR